MKIIVLLHFFQEDSCVISIQTLTTYSQFAIHNYLKLQDIRYGMKMDY